MIVFPNAKINLGLRILRKRPDGFHDLESAFLPVGLTDMLEIVPDTGNNTGKTDRLTLTGIPLEAGDDNLCIRALRLLKDKHGIPDVNLHLHKRIPTGAGLGGGSSDAAFTLRALNEMFGLGLNVPVLMESGVIVHFLSSTNQAWAPDVVKTWSPCPLTFPDLRLSLSCPGSPLIQPWPTE